MNDAAQNPTFRDASEYREASGWPDPADAIDDENEFLLEAFATAASRWNGDLPRCRMAFRAAVVAMIREALGTEEDLGELGKLLQEMRALQVSQERADAVRWMIAMILDANDAQLTADCLAYASGLHALQGGFSEDTIAAKYGLGRAAVSKRVTEYQRRLNLPASPGMKAESAQEVYRYRAHEQHGTQPGHAKKTPTVFAAIGRIAQWWPQVERDGLELDQLDTLRKTFEPVKQILNCLYDIEGWSKRGAELA